MTKAFSSQGGCPSFLQSVAFPHGTQGDLFLLQSEKRAVGWADGKSTLRQGAVSEGLCVRVLDGGGQGLLTTRNLSPDHVQSLVAQAHHLAKAMPKDPHRKIAMPSSMPPSLPSDPDIFEQDSDALLGPFPDLEKAILKTDPRLKKIVNLRVEMEKDQTTLFNSHGLRLQKGASSASVSIEILAEDQGAAEVGWDYRMSRFAKDLDVSSLAHDVAAFAVRSLGGKALASGDYAVVVPPRVGVQFLQLFSEALSAEAVQMEQSFLKGLLGKLVASEKVNLLDDPFIPHGVASEAFDDEGVSHAPLSVIQAGVCQSYFYDLRSASREGRKSTGHGMKGGLASLPSPSPTNFSLQSGPDSPEAFLSSAEKVFVLSGVMGLHMADTATGEFSLGATGFFYENGRFVHPVRGVTIAGQLKSLFQKVIGVGNDLTWIGQFGSPSFLVSHLTVAGQ